MMKLRVAFFADILIEDFGGCCRTVFQLIKSIPKQKFEFLFICGEKPIRKFVHNALHVPTISLPINKKYKMAMPFLSWMHISEKLDRFKPELSTLSKELLFPKKNGGQKPPFILHYLKLNLVQINLFKSSTVG